MLGAVRCSGGGKGVVPLSGRLAVAELRGHGWLWFWVRDGRWCGMYLLWWRVGRGLAGVGL